MHYYPSLGQDGTHPGNPMVHDGWTVGVVGATVMQLFRSHPRTCDSLSGLPWRLPLTLAELVRSRHAGQKSRKAAGAKDRLNEKALRNDGAHPGDLPLGSMTGGPRAPSRAPSCGDFGHALMRRPTWCPACEWEVGSPY